ncbi:MAG: T9SS type A sorting domain-containing protein [Tunicatimonas sp.]
MSCAGSPTQFTDASTAATNAAGCASTTQQTVEVVLPVQDLRLDDFTVADSPTGDGQQLLLTISNRGTRVASGVAITVDLDETLTVEERRTEPLLPGQTVVYVTKFRLPTQQRNQQRPLRYLCARIAATDADFAEAQLDNNRNCRSLNEQLNVEPPFPNPASEQLRVSVILPEAEAVSLRLLNQDGRVVRTHRQEATTAGLNTFLLDVQGLPVGAYLLQVSYQGEQRQFRVAVGR